MKGISIIVLIVVSLTCCSVNRIHNNMDFGNRMAKSGLWREAYFRWQKHLQDGNNTAAVHNNMAIALENMGNFNEAEKEYLNAIELRPGNQIIKENYNRFKNFLKKRKNEK